MKRILNVILLGIGLVLLYFFISRIGFEEIVQTLKGANLFFCFAGVFVYLCGIAVRSRKWLIWGRILRRDLSYKEIVPFFLANSLMGNVTPLKSGEAITPFLFKKYFKISAGRGFSLIILDRFSELVVFMFLLIGAVCYLILRGLPAGLVFKLFFLIFVFLLFIFILTLVVLFSRNLTLKIVRKCAEINFLRKPFGFLEREILHLYEGIALALKEKIYGKVILLTALGWFFDLSSFYFIFLAVLRLSFLEVFTSGVISSAASLAAFIPGGIGIAEISTTSLLGLMGHPLVQVASAVVLVRIFLTGTLIASGIIGFFLMKEKERIDL